jgi:hypothetical protein
MKENIKWKLINKKQSKFNFSMKYISYSRMWKIKKMKYKSFIKNIIKIWA